MMVRKYIVGENELCEFGEVMKNILDASLIESCRTKASDLLRILKKINIGKGLEPYIYDVDAQKLEEIRQGNLSSVSDEYNDKGLMFILDENDYILYISSRIYDVLVSKGDVFMHSDEIQNNIYLDPLTGYILYGTNVDSNNLLVGYGLLDDMAQGQTDGVVSVAGMYSSSMGYRCFGPVYFPEHAKELKSKGHQLSFETHDNCPFCGEPIKLTKHDVEVCSNVNCSGRKMYGIYSIIGAGEIPDAGVRRALKALVNNGYDTAEKIFKLSHDKLHSNIADDEFTGDASEGMDVVSTKVHKYRWNLEHNKDNGVEAFMKNYVSGDKLPLEGMKLYLVCHNTFDRLHNDLELLGATVENFIDKITEEHILLSENPETLAEVIDVIHDMSLAKSIRVVNIGDCKSSIDVTRKLMDESNHIKVSAETKCSTKLSDVIK